LKSVKGEGGEEKKNEKEGGEQEEVRVTEEDGGAGWGELDGRGGK